MDQYIGKFLDNRYELLEVIGTGGMAVVYKARCHRLNRFVAVKILKRDLAQDAEFRRRFHDESQAVAMLSHPNIVAVYDVSHSDDLDYIVMELIDGITLKQYMQKKGMPLNWREALHFITQIMRALSHAHSRGIIHRDIKPHNIMVLRDGSVKVADFGIARLMSAHQSTLTQEALGSVHYISPEQARGSHIDARSDIYSAGVVLYEMTTGRLPFEGDSPVAVAIQHINSIPLSPGELNPEIPEALQEIIMKAMAPNADQRYLSADDMLSDLEEFRKNPNINFDYSSEDLTPCDEPTVAVPVSGAARRLDNGKSQGKARAQGDKRAVEGGAGAQNGRKGQERPAPSAGKPRKETAPRTKRQEDQDDYDDYEDARGPIWPILAAVGVIILFIVGVVAFMWSNFFSGILNPAGESVDVPDLRGRTIAEVMEDSSVSERFEILEGELVFSEEYDAGQIVSQDPKAGTTVKGDELTITVNISAGGNEMTIPDVKNMEQRTAMALLRDNMGLVVSQELENSDEITKGYAIRTDLLVGTTVKKGDVVTLVVSNGPEIKEVTVTSLSSLTLEEAKKQIEKLELTLGEVGEMETNEYMEGLVCWQSVPSGTTVTTNTQIDLKLAVAPKEEPTESPEPSQEPTPSHSPTSEAPEPPVSASPTPSAVPSPSATPAPSQAPSVAKAITVTLPSSAAEKTSVRVRIEVDGVVKKNDTVETILFPISPLISGRGSQEVAIYVDDTLVSRYTENFS